MKVNNGLLSGFGAYVIWGLFPIFFKLLDTVGATEILLHRILWAVPFGAAIIAALGQWPLVARVLRSPQTLAWMVLSALCITGNWFVYIWAVTSERIFEASLGYYINPLMFLVAGLFLFGEKLRPVQSLAALVAAVGVTILATLGSGVPWASLALAALFTAYGVIRKQAPVSPMVGLFVETLVLAPFALAGLLWMESAGQAVFFGANGELVTLLVLAGPITVLPLWLFAVATKELTLAALGFLQFLAPTLQFFTAVFFGEELTLAHMLCFSCIWIAVAMFLMDTVVFAQRQRRLRPR